MSQNSIQLRPAQPDYDEGRIFARYMDQAADGFFRFLLGPHVEQIIASAFYEPRHSLSYEHVTFAEFEGELIGMTSAYTGSELRTFSDKPLERAAGRHVLRLKCMSFLMRPVFRIMSSVTDDDFYLQGIAVDPKLRGRGVGSMLLEDVEQRAQRSGSSSLSLDVARKNTGAQALYARRGMLQSSQWPRNGPVPPLFIRMTKPIESV